MTKDEITLLLYLETCAVDKSGAVDQAHLNDADRKVLKEWAAETMPFVTSGRIAAPRMGTWVRLSDLAWQLAQRERRHRALRTWGKRTWQTTEEKLSA